jgi:hypothetical protein
MEQQKKLLALEEDLDLREEEIRGKELEVNYDIAAQIRRWMTSAIKASQMSRYEIAAKLSELLDKEISKYQLDSWTAESKEGYHLPADYVPALASVLEDFSLVRILAAPLGIQVLENKDLIWLEYGQVRQMERKIRARKKQLEKRLQGGTNEIRKTENR